MDTLFSILFLGAIFAGALWGINIKRKEFSIFVKDKGWAEVRLRIKNSLIKVFRFVGIILLILTYLVGIVGIPLYFEEFFKDGNTDWFIVLYLLFGIFIYYYLTGIKRRGTKNIQLMVKEDSVEVKKSTLQILNELWTLIKSLVILAVFIGVIGLGGWGLFAVGGWVFGSNDNDYVMQEHPNYASYEESRDCSDLEPENPYDYDSGHYAGFEWGENGNYCSGNSDSFVEGCEEYEVQDEAYTACLNN